MKLIKYIIPCFLLVQFYGCYSLNGSSIDPKWQTIRIETFPNYAPQQNPTLGQDFTVALQDIFRNRTKLAQTNTEADLNVSGEITTYQFSSLAIQSGEVAARNRLTIGVRVRYENNQDDTKSFDRTFSDYADFEANQTPQQVEAALTAEINERLVLQIFNAIGMDW